MCTGYELAALGLGGYSAYESSRIANKQMEQAEGMTEWQKELFRKYGEPYMQMLLKQTQQLDPIRQHMLGQLQTLGGYTYTPPPRAGVGIKGSPATSVSGGVSGASASGGRATRPLTEADIPASLKASMAFNSLKERYGYRTLPSNVIEGFLNQAGKLDQVRAQIAATEGAATTGGAPPVTGGVPPVTGGVPPVTGGVPPESSTGNIGAATGTVAAPPVANQPLQWWQTVPEGTTGVTLPPIPPYDPSQLPAQYATDWASLLPLVPEVAEALKARLADVPDWRQPFTQEELRGLKTLSDIGLEKVQGERSSALAGEMARRGLTSSSIDWSKQVGLQNWYDRARAEEASKITLLGKEYGDVYREEAVKNALILEDLLRQVREEQTGQAGLKRGWSVEDWQNAMQRYLTGESVGAARRGEQTTQQLLYEDIAKGRRGEASQAYYNLWNALQGYQAQNQALGSYSSYAGALGDIAKTYSGLAGTYGAMGAGTATNIATWLANYYANKNAGGGTTTSGGGSYASYFPQQTQQKQWTFGSGLPPTLSWKI